jgi:hypothetical protein
MAQELTISDPEIDDLLRDLGNFACCSITG